MAQTLSLTSAPFMARVAFLVEIAKHLHAYGTTTQRLEGALLGVAAKLGVECEPWVNPTGMILTFRDPLHPNGHDLTRVIRLPPGDTDLARLARADKIAEDVLAGQMDIIAGHEALKALNRPRRRLWHVSQVLAFAMTAFGVACLLRLPWLDAMTATAGGLSVGLLVHAVGVYPRLREAMEALAAMMAAILAAAVASFIAPLNLNTVIIAAVIVLMPGLVLANAVSELSSQHLVAGSARFAEALTTLMKLTIGAMIALALVRYLGWQPQVAYARPQPFWVEFLGLTVAAMAFPVVFRASARDYFLVLASAAAGYLIARGLGGVLGTTPAVFISALSMTMLGNLYARTRNRPGALIRLPGIILLVPGSSSFRGLMNLMQEQSLDAGQAALLAVLNVLLALIAGMLFGNLLLPPRRNL